MELHEGAVRARAQEAAQQRAVAAPAEATPAEAPPAAAPDTASGATQLKARRELETALEGVQRADAPASEREVAGESARAREQLEAGLQGLVDDSPPPPPPRAAPKDTPIPATLWNENAVNTVNQRGQEQGGITQEEIDRNTQLAREHVTSGGGVKAEDVAGLVRETGVDLGRLDANQLEAATRYVQEGKDPDEQAERLRKTLNNFQVLGNLGVPKMSRQETNDLIWGAARVPGHATQKLDEQGLSQTFQDVASAVAVSGAHKFEVGDHTLEMKVSPAGEVTSSKTSAPSALSKIGGILKTAVPVVATVAAFIPGVGTAVAAGLRIASAAISGVDAAVHHNFLGVLSAAAGGVAAGFSLGNSAVADKVVNIANSVGGGARGVQSIKQGGVLGVVGGVAGVAGAAAGVSGLSGADKISDVSGKVSTAANRLETAQRFRSAAGAVDQAERQLQAARATGDPEAIARAQEQLDEAHKLKTGALFSGLAVVADVGASHTSGGLSQGFSYASRTLDVGNNLRNKDFISAVVGITGGVARATDSQKLKDAASLADQSNNFRLASQATSRAQKAVDDAERTLELARNSGDPAAIAEAEKSLKGAQNQRNFAETNRSFAGDQLAATGQGIGQRIEFERQFDKNLQALAPSLQQGDQAMADLQAVARDPRATGGFQDLADEAREGLSQAHDDLAAALFSGDADRIAAARANYEAATQFATERTALLQGAFAPGELALPGLATELELPAVQAGAEPSAATASPAARRAPTVRARPASSLPAEAEGDPGMFWADAVYAPEDPAKPFANTQPVGSAMREQWEKDVKADPQYIDRSLALMRGSGPGGALELVKQARGGDDGDGYTKAQIESAQKALHKVYGRDLTAFELRNMDHYLNNYAGMSNLRPNPGDSEWVQALKMGPATGSLDGLYRFSTVGYTAAKAIFGGGIPFLYSKKEGVTGTPDALDWRAGIEALNQYQKDLDNFSRTGVWVYGVGRSGP